MRYVQIDPSVVGPQQVIRMMEVGTEISESAYIDVTERPDITASAWYDVGLGDFTKAPEPEAPAAPSAERIAMLRRAAYAAEGDPLKNEAEYDAIISGKAPNYAAWLAAVAAIKERYPLPK